jgi:adenylate cyclase
MLPRAMPSSPLRARLSYRASLAVVVPLLVAASAGAMLVRSYLATRATIEELSDALFEQISHETVVRTRAHLLQATPTLDSLTELDRRAVRAGDPDVLPRMLAMLRANEGFSWVSYGDEEGTYAAAYRPEPGRVRINESRIVDGRTVLDELDVDARGARTLHRHVDDSGYDPRTRPWYRRAVEAGGRVWLPPYVFFQQGIPGITCAAPQRDESGRIVGVYTVDFDLGALSRFVAEMRLSPHGRVVVFTDDEELLAHPTLQSLTAGGGDAARIVRLADVDDAALASYRRALSDRPTPLPEQTDRFRFEHDGEVWYGSRVRFAIEPGAAGAGLLWSVGAYAPEADFLGRVQAENRTSLWLGALVLAAAIAFAFFLANRVARPLAELARQMDEVGRFELEGRAPPRSVFTEIDAMGVALARMKSGLGSFARFVPRDLVRQVLASGREARLGGELRTLTVVFSDLAGFTTLAEKTSPDELVSRLGGYLERMTRTITAEGGTVDKFLGDGIMSFWGAPAEQPDHAARACVAALRCQRALDEMATSDDGRWVAETHTRIGIATGEVLVGNVGTPDRLNYTVMGDTANLAARLESLCKQYGVRVLASEAAFEGARHRVIARPVDVVAVKGKRAAVRVYELLALADEAEAEAARALAERSERALAAYLARDFAAALGAWEEILAERPDDKAVRTLRDRAAGFVVSPPPDSWDGSWVAVEK